MNILTILSFFLSSIVLIKKSYHYLIGYFNLCTTPYALSAFQRLGYQCCFPVAQLQPMDCSPPGSSVHGILQTRILEWVAISFSRDLPYLGIKPGSLVLADGFFTVWAIREAETTWFLKTEEGRILEWVAISFSRGSSWRRCRTQVSFIVGRSFAVCAISEDPLSGN